MISSEEIVKDRKILKRESFLNLSWFSYLNSKIMILFILSAFQTISFVLIGNLILEIKGMTLSFWLVLFTTSCFSNILGLNISSAFNSVITIYILIPFILIPQLLFSGVLVKFDKLHLSTYSSREYVPVIGDLMTARWSYEAMAVRQFTNNKYKRNIIKYEIAANPWDYYARCLIDRLRIDLNECLKYRNDPGNRKIIEGNFRKLNYYIDKLSNLTVTSPGIWKSSLNIQSFDSVIENEAVKYIDILKKKLRNSSNKILALEEPVKLNLEKRYGPTGLQNLIEDNENEHLTSLALGEELGKEFTIETNDKIIQNYNPGYMKATSKLGRAHFYAPYKYLGNWEIDTFRFNLMVIWFGSIVLYIVLYFNLLRKLLTFIENLRLKKTED